MRVLIIEDSDVLRDSMADGLRRTGYVVETAADGEDGLWRAEARAHDVLILDLGLPKLDGMTLLQRLRATGDTAPVLVLTARDGIDDRVAGLQAGADDYLVKPFAFAELTARIAALLRRSYGASVNTITIGNLEIDTAARSARLDGQPLALARREYALLEVLALNAGAVVSRSEIESRIYDEHVEPNSNVVDAAVSILRKKLDPRGAKSRIETRRGEGYRLCKP